tara:strand:+ start:539 stop:919 length:381 start_codon:yes stop_codon:yes gene_type:complete
MAVEKLKLINKTFIQKEPTKELIRKKEDDGKKSYYYEDKSGNVDVNDLLATILNKIDNVGSVNPRDIYGEDYGSNKSKNLKAIEVDFKKDLYMGSLDTNKIQSEVIEGKVNNKLDKLKALRKRNGS